MKQEEAKKKKIKITRKQIRIGIVLVSVLIFGICYLGVYDKYRKKSEVLKEHTNSIQRQIEEREKVIEANKGLEHQIVKLRTSIDEMVEKYPSNLTIPSNIMFLTMLEEEADMEIPNVTFSENSPFYTSIVPRKELLDVQKRKDPSIEVQAKGEDASQEVEQGNTQSPTMTGIKSTIEFSFLVSYKGLKDCLSFIEKYPERMTVDNLSVTYDGGNGKLSGNMTIQRYAILGNGQEFQNPMLPNVPVGKNVIFDTVKKK